MSSGEPKVGVPKAPEEVFIEGPSPVLLNKAEWHTKLEDEVRIAKSTGSPLSVIFADVNYFKEINTVLGQPEGDRVIEEMRALVVNCFRVLNHPDREPRDLDVLSVSEVQNIDEEVAQALDVDPGHIGGDEFALICRGDKAVAQKVADRLGEAFSRYLDKPENERLKDLEISLGIGIGVLESDMTTEDLLMMADREMYQDKLNQLPLTRRMKVGVILARTVFSTFGIRQRDVPKIWRQYF